MVLPLMSETVYFRCPLKTAPRAGNTIHPRLTLDKQAPHHPHHPITDSAPPLPPPFENSTSVVTDPDLPLPSVGADVRGRDLGRHGETRGDRGARQCRVSPGGRVGWRLYPSRHGLLSLTVSRAGLELADFSRPAYCIYTGELSATY